MKTKIFVTNSKNDESFVLELGTKYENISVMTMPSILDDFGSNSSIKNKREIKNSIKRCQYLLCIVSENTAKDPWVEFAIMEAKNIQKSIIYMRKPNDTISNLPKKIIALKSVLNWDEEKIKNL